MFLTISLVTVSVSLPCFAKKRFKYKVARFVESKGVIYMNVSFPELFTKKLKKKIKSGFVQTIMVRVTLRDALTKERLVRTVWTCTLVYDLWEKRYLVRVADTVKSSTYKVEKPKDAIKRSTTIHRIPLIDGKKIETSRYYYVGLRILYNPMSKQLIKKVKRWLKSPREGGHDRMLESSSFFGSSLSFFVNPRISPAERLLRLRTQYFYRTEK